MDILTFNGTPLSDFGVFWDGSQLFDTPEKQVEFFEIPGRNGDLSISQDRFKNLDININCFIREDFIQHHRDLINFLLSQDGYQRLENSKEPDVYRMAQYVAQLQPSTGAFLKYGNFTLTFNCKPQKWLKLGEDAISISSAVTIVNPTNFDALPLLKVSGTGTITINDSQLELSENTSTTYIDCDIQDAYEGTINRNDDLTITNGFPVLKPGNNSVSVSGCTVMVIPRWWVL